LLDRNIRRPVQTDPVTQSSIVGLVTSAIAGRGTWFRFSTLRLPGGNVLSQFSDTHADRLVIGEFDWLKQSPRFPAITGAAM